MNADTLFALARDGLWQVLLLSAPVLLAVALTGLAVAVLQAATQVHEQALAFVPKLVVAVLVLMAAGPWMLSLLVDLFQRSLQAIPLAVS